MYKIKRIFALLLALSLISNSVFSVRVSAAENEVIVDDSNQYNEEIIESINNFESSTSYNTLSDEDNNYNYNQGWNFIDGKWYYCNNDLTLLKGWLYENGIWYYMNEEGIMLTGLNRIGEHLYYFNQSGAMINNGWNLVNGNWYYFNGSGEARTGWFLSGVWYYMNKEGVMLTGVNKIDNYIYYFNQSGAMMSNGWNLINGNWYYFNGSGEARTGWFLSGVWYYMNEEGIMLTGLNKIDNNLYYFNQSGAMINNGWNLINGNWYYFNGSGEARTGWFQNGSQLYYLQDDGIMSIGFTNVDNNTYYMNSSGAVHKGWLNLDGDKYYFRDNGVMATGKINISGQECEFDESGKLVSILGNIGWKLEAGKWYYYDQVGQKIVGWIYDSDKIYYCGSDGAMISGWSYIDNKWYYFRGSGEMAFGWLIYNSDTTYYLDQNGVMVTGWTTIDGYEYYFDNSGKMAIFQFVDGKYLGGDGAVKSKNDIVIVIDPGHNFGGDDGAYAIHNGKMYVERELNMQVALKLKNLIEANGYKVILTREENDRETIPVRESLEKRVNIANNSNADLFISLHHDSTIGSSAKGVTAFYGTYRPNIETDGMVILPGDVEIDVTPSRAAIVSRDFATSLINNISSSMNYNNRGAQDWWLYVTRYTTMPSILLECGFISNPEEARRAADHNNQQRLAEVIMSEINKLFRN